MYITHQRELLVQKYNISKDIVEKYSKVKDIIELGLTSENENEVRYAMEMLSVIQGYLGSRLDEEASDYIKKSRDCIKKHILEIAYRYTIY